MRKMNESIERIPPELIAQRKYELCIRDPLSQELIQYLGDWGKTNSNKFPDKTEVGKTKRKVLRLTKKITNKWKCTISTGGYDPKSWFMFPTEDIVVKNLGKEIEANLKYMLLLNKLNFLPKEQIKGTIQWKPEKGKILLEINTRTLTEKKKTETLNNIWEIISKKIPKKKTKKQWRPSPKKGEDKELGFIYSTKENVFQNYLKWYDWHTEHKLKFRHIAHIDKTNKTNSIKASKILEIFKHKKIKWGISVKGEDKIEKGVKLVFKAIHRKSYSQRDIEPLIEDFNCPNHKKDECPKNCTYLKQWEGYFNRLHLIS
jgi:hypothetical protein